MITAGAAVPAVPIPMLTRFAGSIAALRGWRRYMTALTLGAVAALAMPPTNVFPVLVVAFPILIWLIDGCMTGRSAFFTGWWFAFGHHLVGLYWIANAFLVDAGSFAWLIPVICAGLPAYLALFVGAATWLTYRLSIPGISRVLLFAAAWAIGEWLRGRVLSGFPWNLLGYAWTDSTAMLQVTAVIGIYGLSLLTVLAVSSPAALATRDMRRGLCFVLAIWSLMLLAWLGGDQRLSDAGSGTVDGVRLRIVQANIPQRMKWAAGERLSIFNTHLSLSATPAKVPPTHIIWPETAVPFFFAEEPLALRAAAAIVPLGGALLTGSPREQRDVAGERQIFNSLLVEDANGQVVESFDKFHLVPLGEYVPLRKWLNLSKVTPGAIDFTPGPGPRTLSAPGLPPFSPLICYEVIFPHAVAGQPRPSWILNVTNDGWYGNSTGPYQHLQIARVRAVEEGLPLVRAANTGISAVVDPYGRITAKLDLQETGVLDSSLPTSLANPTLYARFGDASFFLLIFVMTLIPAKRALPIGRRN